jgi:hypothetical protein
VTVGTVDRKTLLLLSVAVLMLIAVLRFRVFNDSDAAPVVAPADSIPMAEQRLQKVRQLAAMVPGKEAVLKQANADLAIRERGLIGADTAEQAKAQLLDVIHRVAAANGIDARGLEQSNVKQLANDYGEVTVGITFNCGIEQLVNFLAAIANEPQILATNEIHVSGGSDKKKNVLVRLSLSGVVPKKLVPAKKGVAAF